jgi:hypothetical protein
MSRSLGRPEAGCMLKMAELPANVFPVNNHFSVTKNSDENKTSLTIFMTSSIAYGYESFITWRVRYRGTNIPF